MSPVELHIFWGLIGFLAGISYLTLAMVILDMCRQKRAAKGAQTVSTPEDPK